MKATGNAFTAKKPVLVPMLKKPSEGNLIDLADDQGTGSLNPSAVSARNQAYVPVNNFSANNGSKPSPMEFQESSLLSNHNKSNSVLGAMQRSNVEPSARAANNPSSMMSPSVLADLTGDSMTSAHLGPRRAAALEPSMSGATASLLLKRGGSSEFSDDDDDEDGDTMMSQVRKYQERLKARGKADAVDKMQRPDTIQIDLRVKEPSKGAQAQEVADFVKPAGILKKRDDAVAGNGNGDVSGYGDDAIMQQVRAHQEKLKAQDAAQQRQVDEIEEEEEEDADADAEADDDADWRERDEEGADVAGVMGILTEGQKREDKLRRKEKRKKKREKRAMKQVC